MRRNRDILKKYSWILNVIFYVAKFIPKTLLEKLLNILRPFDGKIVMLIRYICVKNCSKSCGENVAIFSNVYIYNIKNLVLGNNVSIHPMCYIQSSGGIEIGDDVSIAHSTTIMSEEHIYIDSNINIKDQGCEFKKTIIKDNVWVGAGVRVLAGSQIESGSIVAAGAVVKGQIGSNSIFGGIPAKFIKKRA